MSTMPSVRYYHHRKYQQPSKPVHFLPPLRLTTTSTHDDVSYQNSIESRVRDTTKRSDHNPQARSKRVYTQYKKLLFTIASSLTTTDINDLKFLCRDHIQPTHHIDNVRNSWSFILLLENKKLLADNSLVFLQTLLYYVGRTDLYALVFRFRADRQKEYKDNGVGIHQKMEVRVHDPMKMELAREMLEFRRKLKKTRRNNKPNIVALQQRLSELSTRVQTNINEMNSYKSRPTANQGPMTQSIQPIQKTDINEHDKEEIICDRSEVRIDRKSCPDAKTHQETLKNVLNKDENTQIITKEKHTVIIKETVECSTQLGAPNESHYEEYYLSEEAVLAETPMPPPHKGEEFTVKGHRIREKYKHCNSNVPSSSSNPKQEKHEEKNVALKIKQIRKRFGKDNLHKLRYQHSKRTKKRKKRKKETQAHLDSDDSSNSEPEENVKFPNIYEKFARTSRLPANTKR